ncbi:MAG: hypothetical protein V2A74_01590 [bacterium]
MKKPPASRKPPTVYLAGSIEHSPDGGRCWRAELTPFLRDELGHKVYDPSIEETHDLTEDEKLHFRTWKTNQFARFQGVIRRVIDQDLSLLLNKTDYVICFWDQHVLRGAGTHGELTLAYWNKIPVYLVLGFPRDDVSSWILGCVEAVFDSFDELKSFLRKRYGKKA